MQVQAVKRPADCHPAASMVKRKARRAGLLAWPFWYLKKRSQIVIAAKNRRSLK
jgi:hypothetical protein